MLCACKYRLIKDTDNNIQKIVSKESKCKAKQQKKIFFRLCARYKMMNQQTYSRI